MARTAFSVGNSGSLATVLQDLTNGADSAINTAYTITLTAALLATSETVTLPAGSSVTLQGPYPFDIATFDVGGSLIADLNFTGTVTLDNGVFNNGSLTTVSGTIVAGLYTGSVLGTLSDHGDTAINSGTILSSGTYAAIELGSGTVLNGWNGPPSALVSGTAGGVLIENAGVTRNDGSIVSSGSTTAAVFLGSGTVDNGQIGFTAASLSGGENGLEITGAGVVANDGTVTGIASTAVYVGSGIVTNGQAGVSTALIDGGAAGNGVWIGTGLGTVTNFGGIIGGADGVFLAQGGTLNNSSSLALVIGALDGAVLGAAGLVANDGTIKVSGASQSASGVFLEAGGTIENLTSGAQIGGVGWGAIAEGAAGTVTNFGTIDSSGASGLGVDLTAGGTIDNAGTAATISGAFDGARISAGAGASVQNAGTIEGTVGIDFKSGPTPAAGTLTNDGLIESTTGTSGYAVEFGAGAERLVLRPAGVFVGGVLGDNASGSSTTLELAAGTQGSLSGLANDAGTVTDGAGSFGFSAIGTITVDTGAAWTVAAANTFDTLNISGGLTVAAGAVSLSGSLTTAGAIAITGGTLTAAAGVLTDQGVITVGPGATLKAAGGGIAAAGISDILIGGSPIAALDASGAGATVNSNGYRIAIGSSEQGSAQVSQGATLLAGTPFAADEAIVVGGAGATGALTVTDPGSRVTATGQLAVGLGGAGSLLIENQATVSTGGNSADTTEGFDVAQLAGGSGQATVTGSQALLTNVGRFVVGDGALGSLSIAGGATVATTPGTASGLAGAVIANAAGASGSSVDVSGGGSNWRVTGVLNVGVDGSGSLQISQGATVTASSLDAGDIATAIGQLSVTGAGSALLVAGSATVSDDGTGVLSVLNGASFSAQSLTIGNQTDSSGALVVSGNNTTLTVSGELNIGTALGTGDLTVGPGAVVNASVVNLQGGVVLEGGVLDPTVYIENGGGTTGGFGTIASDYILLEGTILSNGSKTGKQTEVVQGTLVGGGTADIKGSVSVNGPGILQIGTHDTIELTGAVLNTATTTFTDNLTPTGTYSVNNSVIDVVFQDGTGVLQLDDIAGFAGTVATWKAGDSFVITGGTLSNAGVSNGDTLTFSDSGAGAAAGGIDSIIFGSAISQGGFSIVNGNTVQAVACFAAGTRIMTRHGWLAVEALRVGGHAVTADGEEERIVWIGQRLVNCRRHPDPETVWPVRVRAGAFGENIPVRDLYLSPDHAVFVNGVLIPVRLLTNGTSIAPVKRHKVMYLHVELPRHAIILAEGLTVESYLDFGGRGNFHDAGETIRLVPDFAADPAQLWETLGAAPLLLAGDELARVRRAIAARASASAPGPEPRHADRRAAA